MHRGSEIEQDFTFCGLLMRIIDKVCRQVYEETDLCDKTTLETTDNVRLSVNY